MRLFAQIAPFERVVARGLAEGVRAQCGSTTSGGSRHFGLLIVKNKIADRLLAVGALNVI